jgi:hypothetical protein
MKASRRPVGDHATLPSWPSLVKTFFRLSPLESITQSSLCWPLIKASDELSGEVAAGHACALNLRGLPPKTEASHSTLPSASVPVLRRRFSPSENHCRAQSLLTISAGSAMSWSSGRPCGQMESRANPSPCGAQNARAIHRNHSRAALTVRRRYQIYCILGNRSGAVPSRRFQLYPGDSYCRDKKHLCIHP